MRGEGNHKIPGSFAPENMEKTGAERVKYSLACQHEDAIPIKVVSYAQKCPTVLCTFAVALRKESVDRNGGTWERISERFLLGASGSFPAGSTGGESAHKLTQSELPNYSLFVANGSNVIRSKTGSSADAYVQTQSSGWGIPNWESKTVTVASGGSGAAHNNMPPYLSVWIWKRTR